MWVVVAVAATVLGFNVPCYEADRRFSECDSATFDLHIPERPLTVVGRFWYLDDQATPVVDQHPVTPCTRGFISVPWDSIRPATVCATLLDPSLNESPCRTCVALGVWPVGIAPPTPEPPGAARRRSMLVHAPYRPSPATRLYTLSGQRVSEARVPGGYFTRDSLDRVMKVIVVR